MEWSLALSSSESVRGKGHGLSDVLVLDGEGSGGVWVLAVWYHLGKQGVQETCLSIILPVVMGLE